MPVRPPLTRSLASLLLAAIAAAPAPPRAKLRARVQGHFPGSDIVEHQGDFIAYATNAGINLPMLTSRDLVHWAWVTGGDGKRRDACRTSRPG